MNRNELESRLAALPEELEFEFELKLTELARSMGDADRRALLEILRDETSSSDIRYAAFYALCIYFRRLKELGDLRDLNREFADVFGGRPLASHIRALYLQTTRSADSIDETLACARRAVQNAPDHAGVVHHLAELLTIEQEIAEDASAPALEAAEENVGKAIALTGGAYGRYYATRARINILKGLYDEAEFDLNYAIDKEQAQSQDYALRVGEYQLIKLEARFSKSARRLRDQQLAAVRDLDHVRRDVDEKLETARAESLQMLGLLAAVIAFVVTGAQIATSGGTIEFDTTGRVLLLAAGAVTAIFGISAIALFPMSWERLLRSTIVAGFGAVAVAASVSWWEWLT